MALHRLNWVPDKPDFRDHLLSSVPLPPLPLNRLPEKSDPRSSLPPVFDQGQLGSCTGNALAYQFMALETTLGSSQGFIPARLFIYYNERALEGNIRSDAGASLRDGIKTLAQNGVCQESEWPYLVRKFADKPFNSCYSSAQSHMIKRYARVPRDLMVMKALLAIKFYFVIGFSVYESFESNTVERTGIMPMPQPHEKMLGGHAVCVVGFDDMKKSFIVANSWSSDWGENGFFYMPYDYLMDQNLSDDFWQVTLI